MLLTYIHILKKRFASPRHQAQNLLCNLRAESYPGHKAGAPKSPLALKPPGSEVNVTYCELQILSDHSQHKMGIPKTNFKSVLRVESNALARLHSILHIHSYPAVPRTPAST